MIVALGILGAAVGGGQIYVYVRQAAIKGAQTQITERQLAEVRLEGRAWITADIQIVDPITFPTTKMVDFCSI
jgi:hypothetical protein